MYCISLSIWQNGIFIHIYKAYVISECLVEYIHVLKLLFISLLKNLKHTNFKNYGVNMTTCIKLFNWKSKVSKPF